MTEQTAKTIINDGMQLNAYSLIMAYTFGFHLHDQAVYICN